MALLREQFGRRNMVSLQDRRRWKAWSLADTPHGFESLEMILVASHHLTYTSVKHFDPHGTDDRRHTATDARRTMRRGTTRGGKTDVVLPTEPESRQREAAEGGAQIPSRGASRIIIASHHRRHIYPVRCKRLRGGTIAIISSLLLLSRNVDFTLSCRVLSSF